MNNASLSPFPKMALPSPQTLDILLNYMAIGSALCGAVGSATALGVDFLRRRVRAKASEYAASNDFKLLRENLLDSREVFDKFLVEYRSDHSRIQDNHLDMCQRVSKLEAKIHG
jgi:hypothetical protein